MVDADVEEDWRVPGRLAHFSCRRERCAQGRIQDLATGGPIFNQGHVKELFFAVFCDMREPV